MFRACTTTQPNFDMWYFPLYSYRGSASRSMSEGLHHEEKTSFGLCAECEGFLFFTQLAYFETRAMGMTQTTEKIESWWRTQHSANLTIKLFSCWQLLDI